MRTRTYDPNELVVIRTYSFEYEAELARALLETAEIPVVLLGHGNTAFGTGGVRLAVCRGDAEEARAALDAPPMPAEAADEDP